MSLFNIWRQFPVFNSQTTVIQWCVCKGKSCSPNTTWETDELILLSFSGYKRLTRYSLNIETSFLTKWRHGYFICTYHLQGDMCYSDYLPLNRDNSNEYNTAHWQQEIFWFDLGQCPRKRQENGGIDIKGFTQTRPTAKFRNWRGRNILQKHRHIAPRITRKITKA